MIQRVPNNYYFLGSCKKQGGRLLKNIYACRNQFYKREAKNLSTVQQVVSAMATIF